MDDVRPRRRSGIEGDRVVGARARPGGVVTRRLGAMALAGFLGLLSAVGTSASAQQAGGFSIVAVSGGDHPMIHGTAALPGGTQIMVMLTGPFAQNAQERLAAGLSACVPGCWFPSAPTPMQTVTEGTFSAGPFSFNGSALEPGAYRVDVFPDLSTVAVGAPWKPLFTSVIQIR